MTLIELLHELKGQRTQREFADMLGISQVHVSMLLSGERAAGRKVAEALIRAFPDRRSDILAAFFAQEYGNPDIDTQVEPEREAEGDA